MSYSGISGDRLLSDTLRALVSRKVNHQILKGIAVHEVFNVSAVASDSGPSYMATLMRREVMTIKTRAAMTERLRLLFEPHNSSAMKIAQYAG